MPVPEAKEPASAPPEPPPARIEAPAPPPRAAARMESAAPRIPSATVPLVFGVLGIAAVLLLPLTAAFRNNRVVEILALLAWAILAPFAPFAWFTAERYLDRCRVLGFAPAPGAQTGKILGALSSFLLVFEFSALAVFIVIQALSGKINCPLWK
ncbi:MAG: hypothetical protein HY293_07695 [Planctomycetes bacterium]|nr:hypothetical protein [Planctomycetota bacterium]